MGRLQLHGIRSRRLVYRKWLKLDQTIRNLTSGDLEISLVVIQVGVIRLKKTRVKYLLNLFEGSEEKERCDLVCVECL